MDLGSILLGLALLLVVAFVVLRPILERSGAPDVDGDAPGGRDLMLNRDQVLAQLRDLDFDHATGKLNDEDYAAQRAQLVAQGVEILKALDGQAGSAAVSGLLEDDPIEAAVAQRRARRTAPAVANHCPNCKARVMPDDRFCPRCGRALR